MKVINANLNEGGYAEKMGMMPSNTGIAEAELSGKIKKIRLSM